MQKFSERNGVRQVSIALQKDNITTELRNSIWNILHRLYWESSEYIYTRQGGNGDIENFVSSLNEFHFKKPVDELPKYGREMHAYVKKYYFKAEWYEVFDFIEFFISVYPRDEQVVKQINFVLKRELSAYRLVTGKFTDITDEQEIEALEEAIGNDRFKGVSGHLRRALELLSDRENPDYRNSIKESISAVESMVNEISREKKTSLGKALNHLEKNGKIHKSLKDGYSKMYGYTSDEDGIRHAMMEKPDICSDDAKYFLLSCTSFTNYLKTKI